jgi:hypothetical protein
MAGAATLFGVALNAGAATLCANPAKSGCFATIAAALAASKTAATGVTFARGW